MRCLAFIFFFVSIFTLSAQKLKLVATVQNAQTGAFVSVSNIQINNQQFKCDTNGYLEAQLLPGEYDIKISKREYRNFQQHLTLKTDTTLTFFLEPIVVNLDEVTVQAQKDNDFGISRLNNVEGTTIYAGKKSEAIYLQDLNANLATNNSRQIFAKIAGINIFENDGSGATIGIGGRGLDPNRISNFNTRQNGYDISADALGYPESYYTPPTEAIERIEILRGAAGLQFGSQFGGMINYKFSEPSSKRLAGDFRQTIGSFGLLNSFNKISGTIKRFTYSTFYQYKHYEGWRSRSALNSHNAFASVGYRFTDKLSLKAEFTFLNYLAQQPGGLTDAQFKKDATMVTRQRNWFKVNWNLASVSLDYKLNSRTRISVLTFGLMAGRDALGVLTQANRADDTSSFRNLLQDKYSNRGAEIRFLRRYQLLNNSSHFLLGARIYKGNTVRKQGDADKSGAANFNFLNPDHLENSSYLFPSTNYAIFNENIFQLTSKWNLTPGLRYEYIQTSSEGYYRLLNKNNAGTIILDKMISDNRVNSRQFILAGVGSQYKFSSSLEAYGNFSQNYRSINFSDMRVENPNFQVDPALKDETGFTADGGFRGAIKNLLYFDASLFLIKYRDRIGTDLRVDSATFQLIRYRTNIDDSRNTGLEAVVELDWLKLINNQSKAKLSTFINFAYINAIYQSDRKEFNGKKVEFVPDFIIRTGIAYAFKGLKINCQYSYVTEQFSEATNAVSSATGIYGIIPAYSVIDLSASYLFKFFTISAGVNNLANSQYFTRRATGYPGPSIIPADPINGYVTIRVSF